jgi:two-component system response regulator PilR (NtrC family)
MSAVNKKILVVDDEEPVRSLLKDFLASQGYDVACYSSAVTALKFLRENTRQDVALIMSDVRMSPVDGMEFLSKVKAEFPQVPVILFSGLGSQTESLHAKKMGAVHYLSKPFSLGTLKSSVEDAIRRKK